jgi:hypothetical protein
MLTHSVVIREACRGAFEKRFGAEHRSRGVEG